MQTIASVAEIAEAQLIRSVLQGYGIEATIPHSQIAEVAPHLSWADGGVVVQVAEKDVEQAKAILASTAQDAAAAIEREQDESNP